MTRLWLSALIAICLFPTLISPEPREPEGASIERQFVQAFNTWALLRKNAGVVDVREIWAWHETQKAWKSLNSIVRYD